MLHALILAGGAGTRFWPLSRRARPKHLLPLGEEQRTLLEEAARRLGPLCPPERVWVVTTADQGDAVRAGLPFVPSENVLVEPCLRDTAAAIGLGAEAIARRDPDGILVAMPADHVIRPESRYRAVIESAARIVHARPDAVVTIGIPPTEPATGYGYLQLGALLQESARPDERALRALPHRAHRVDAFREKPARALAERYLAEGGYAWNAGIFVWRARALLAALERYLPETRAALALLGSPDAGLAKAYAALAKISIDYAVLERHEEVYAVEADFQWSDVGAWTALPELFGQDADGTTTLGVRHVGLGSKDLIVCGEGDGLVATIGLEGLIIVRTDDAVLVCARERAQEIKALVEGLGARGLERLL